MRAVLHSSRAMWPPIEPIRLCRRAVKPPDVGLLAAGGDNTCAVAQDGAPRRWGGNDVGQVGDGTTANRNVPALVVGLT